MSEKVLWTNSVLDNEFSGQTVTLSETIRNYDYVRAYFRATRSINQTFSILFPVNEFIYANSQTNTFKPSVDFNLNTGRYDRCLMYVSDTSINISNSYQVNHETTNNNVLIPIQITGVKIS